MKDNILIAKFMEIEQFVNQNKLEYHNSWDWLMPVVSKISSMCDEPYELDNMKHALLTGDIESVYYDVVEFIKQYNKTK